MLVALTPLALAGCSTNPSSGGAGDQTITVGELGDTGMRSVIDDFEKKNPGTDVELKKIDANSYGQVMTTQLVGGTAPDLIRTYPGAGSNLSIKVAGDKKFFADLSDQPYASSIDATTKKLLVGSDGKLYGIPLTTSAIGAIYNEDALKAADLTAPTTWPELLDFCSAAKAKGKVAFGLGLKDAWSGQLIPYALTASLVYGPDPTFVQEQTSGSKTFEDSGWNTAFQKYLEMNQKGCFNASPNGTAYSQVEDAVRKGNTLAMVSPASEMANLRTNGPKDLKLTLKALPATDSAKDTYLSATTGVSYSVNARSKNPELAKKFLDYLMDPSVQATYAADSGDAPAITDSSTKPSDLNNLISQYSDEKHLASWPDQEWPNATVQSTHLDVVQAMFTGSLSEADALREMDAAFKSSN